MAAVGVKRATAGGIVLIGMPAVGKSSVGVLLAKRTSRHFVDTDVEIQASYGRSLQDIIDNDGTAAFRRLEEQTVCALPRDRAVVATGGSVVYSDTAMRHLKGLGTVVFLDAPLEVIRRRIGDLDRRGLVRRRGQSLESLYAERLPLYRRWADVTVEAGHGSAQDAVERTLDMLGV